MQDSASSNLSCCMNSTLNAVDRMPDVNQNNHECFLVNCVLKAVNIIGTGGAALTTLQEGKDTFGCSEIRFWVNAEDLLFGLSTPNLNKDK